MRLHREDGPPCRHMEGLLNQAADGSSRGLRRWYAVSHAAKCNACGKYLRRLHETLGRLRAARVPAPADVMARLEAVIPREE